MFNEKGHKVVFGIFQSRTALEAAVDDLKTRGFRNSDISALLPSQPSASGELAHEKSSKAPEGASVGAASGVALGGALGWLVGVGALAIPGIGPFVAAGPILAALAGAGIGGTLGGIGGALVGFGIPEIEAKRYEALVKDGGLLLSVHADDNDWVKRAEAVFKEHGALEVTSTSEVRASASDRKDRALGDEITADRSIPYPHTRVDANGKNEDMRNRF